MNLANVVQGHVELLEFQEERKYARRISAFPYALDITDGESVRQVREEVSACTGGKLDILVNSA